MSDSPLPKLQVLGNLQRGLLFVISAPAGTGKTTLVERLVASDPSIVESISYTTRSPRPGEEQGGHYFFIDEAQFKQKIAEGEFLEYARIYGDYYGTSKKWVEQERSKGKHVILVIDTQGAMLLKGRVEACFLFLLPPSFDELRQRLTQRKTETAEHIERRLNWSKKEFMAVGYYDYLIINDDIDVAYEVMRSIIIAEEHKARWILTNPLCPAYLNELSSSL